MTFTEEILLHIAERLAAIHESQLATVPFEDLDKTQKDLVLQHGDYAEALNAKFRLLAMGREK